MRRSACNYQGLFLTISFLLVGIAATDRTVVLERPGYPGALTPGTYLFEPTFSPNLLSNVAVGEKVHFLANFTDISAKVVRSRHEIN